MTEAARMNAQARPAILSLLAALFIVGPGRADAQAVLDSGRHHLGTAGEPEWDEFAEDAPEGRELVVRFSGKANAGEATLFIRQRDVKLDWPVTLNDRPIGRLHTMEGSLVHTLAVPAGALRDGPNTLRIGPPPGLDDVVIEEIRLDPRAPSDAIGRTTLEVRATDAETGRGLPCRLTIVDRRGSLAPLRVEPGSRLAARPGVVYTPDGRAAIGLPPGDYTVAATRGFEYGLDRKDVTLAEGESLRLDLAIRREVPTPGLVACDTHVHTLTHSGHGDATIDERALTMAGEGIELAVATDHDHLTTDLEAAAERMGVRPYFTPVVGDEVTTRVGHFNAFPFPADATPPDPKLDDWGDLLRAIREAPGPRVVVLNHPRDLHAGFRPFAPDLFNPVTGSHRRGMPEVDAVEVVNSGATQTDPMRLVRDWMALRNHGERIAAVGASDSHDVARYIVGQGRTYVALPGDDPGRLDVEASCRSLREGRATVSLGLLARLTVDDRFGAGDLATGLGDRVRVVVEVYGPSWTHADRVELYADGFPIREASVEATPDPRKARLTWELPRPRHDVSLVAVASGPGVTDPAWAIAKPYQPTSRSWTPRVLGITNPVGLDGDGDGAWTSPRGYAASVVERAGTDPARLLPALASYDEAVAAQAAELCQAAGGDVRDADFSRRLEQAEGAVRRGFAAFAETLGDAPRGETRTRGR